MSSPNGKVVHIKTESEQKKLSTAQKKFNSLIKKIDAQKKLLREWQETVPVYQQRVCNEYEVLFDSYNDYRVELVSLFDSVYDNKLFKKADKAKLKHLIVDIAMDLIAGHGREELKELYNKHSGSDFDTDNQEQDEVVGQMMKTMLEGMFGVDIGDDVDVSSPEKMQAVLHEKLQQQREQTEEQQRLAEEKRSKRKKTAKQLEKEAQQQQEEQNVSKSIQEVFRKLVAVLHPDREPDAAERERKTKIMQEVNVAYGKKDLLRLLELQLEIEQIDQTQLNNIAEERLKYFNKILQEQFNELQQEVWQVEQAFKMQTNKPSYLILTPKKLLWELDHDIQELQQDIAQIKSELEEFQFPPALKAWLKTYKIPKQNPDFDDFFF